MRVFTLACALFFALCLSRAQAQILIYSDIATFSGYGFEQGGATVISGDTVTKMVADDLTFAPNTVGASVNGFTFSVSNFNSTAVTARPLVRFYADSATGGLGTYLIGFNFNAITFTAGTTSTFTYNPGTTMFTVPSTDSIWAGVTFDNNNGATGATAAQMNLLGQGLFNPPTVGSSQDLFFESTSAGTFTASNPAGSFYNFGGSPVGNFGWQVYAATPEPSNVAFLLGLGLSGAIFLKRRKK